MRLFILLICVILLENAYGWHTFWKGHRKGGNLIAPHSNLSRNALPPDQWFDQKLDHFTSTNNQLWKQVIAQFCIGYISTIISHFECKLF